MEKFEIEESLKKMMAPGEYVIRTGKAAEVRERVNYRVTGNICSPRKFAEVRGTDPQNDIVEYSLSEGKIAYAKNVHDYNLRDEIVGQLAVNPELLKFKINTDSVYTVSDFLKFIKMRKVFFDDPDKNFVLCQQLSAFKAKFNTDVSAQKDERGNKHNSLTRTIETGIMTDFVLKMPVYVGEGVKTFRVEIGIDSTDGSSIQIFLQSTDLAEILMSEGESLIEKEVEYFRSAGIACIQRP